MTTIPQEFKQFAEQEKKNYNSLIKQLKKEYKIENYPEIYKHSPDYEVIKILQSKMFSATAKAYPIQGILKYHGMPDWQYRTAFFPSISLTNDCAYTKTTVTFPEEFKEDYITINKKPANDSERKRVLAIIDYLRKLANTTQKIKIESDNYYSDGKEIPDQNRIKIPLSGLPNSANFEEIVISSKFASPKGLGTSASAGAALALAATHALFGKKYSSNMRFVSTIARLLAGSACRSVTGGISLWLSYPGIAHEDCFAIRIDKKDQFSDCILITIPIASKDNIKTEMAHLHAQTSPFFRLWLQQRKQKIVQLLQAIKNNDLWTIAKLAEQDTLNLHNITMTSNNPIVLYEPETMSLMELCYKLRNNGIQVYFSIDTGPTVVLITDKENKNKVENGLKSININNYIIGKIAAGAELV
ncbi:GHMP kinase [Candidatus Woesearchaeota archaeon]|nr:GHMP kinase [Candidatus Woesearchaeota archaeon]